MAVLDEESVDLQRENAELRRLLAEHTAERDEALARQTATAEVLQVINASPGDLAPVFEAMLERSMRLCEASFGFLSTYDGEYFDAVALHGLPEAYVKEYLTGPYLPGPHTTHDRLVQGERVVHIPNLALDSADSPRRKAVVETLGVRSILAVPLRKDNSLLGAIHVYRREVQPFDDKQIALVENFATQAVIAIENARLINETREALEQQTATAEVLQVINSSPGDLAPVFDAMLEKAINLCGAVCGILRIFDGERFHTTAMHGVPERYAESLRTEPQEVAPGTAAERLLGGAAVVHVLGVAAEELYDAGEAHRRALADLGGVRATLIVPLKKDGKLLGALQIYRRHLQAFSDKQVALLQNFAAQAVIAMENARLVTETRQALDQQTATAEVLQVINSSPGDLKPVLDAILEKAHTLCGAEYGVLLTFDGERFWPTAVHGDAFAFSSTMQAGIRPGFGFRKLLQGERFLHIDDMAVLAGQLPDDPLPRALVEVSGIRTQLAIPLRKDGKMLGIITANRREVRPFSEKQIALLENFAAQAVIAMENARLLTETRETLEQQTATAEVLQVINSSPGDLKPVFDALLERATRLCGADFATLLLYESDRFATVAVRNVPEAYADFVRRNRPVHGPGTGPARILGGERVVHIPDLKEDEPYRTGDPNRRALVDLGGARSLVTVPLLDGETVLGLITVYRQELRAFTDKQIVLLQNFAAQAVIAIENARLINETREALEQQTATAEVLQVINASPGNLAPVFDAMLERAMRLCEAEFGQLATYDGERLRTAATRGVPAAFAEYRKNNPPIYGPGTTPARILKGERVIRTDDLKAEPVYRSGEPNRRALVDLGGARSAVIVALRKEDAVLGFIEIYRQEVRPFSDKQVALLENFAAQAVIAIENARLLTETREALEQQTATAEVLQVINASPGDLAPVFDAILKKAHTLCGAVQGAMFLFNDGHFRAVATRGMPEAFNARMRAGMRGAGYPLTEPLLAGERFNQIVDIALVDHPITRAAVELAGARTVLAVALRKDDVLLGQIVAARREVRPFSDKEIALIENFAAQAVIAMENARLLTETREALEQQTATAEVLQVINASPGDLAPVFDAMLEKTMRLCDARFGQLVTSADGEIFTIAAAQGPSAIVEFLRNRPPTRPGSGTTMERLVRGERCVHIHDAMAEEAYRRGDPTRRALVDLGGCRTLVSVGLRKDDAMVGAITVYRSEVKPFSTKEIALLENFAAQAVIAMENARLLGELRARTEEVAAWNRELEDRVAAQLGELERVGRLKRFLAPQLAEMIVARGDENILETHRRDIVVVFCDLRGFTAFAETAEPEEVLDLLREYHGALGPIVSQSEGTLDHFSGDGIMVFFNDPVPVPDASERAVGMAIEMRRAMGRMQAQWRRQGREIGFGVGIARGYATLGQIGFADRIDYTAIGTVCNLAARLCAEAKDGQILLSRRVAAAVEDAVTLEEIGDLALKGLMQAVGVYNVAGE
jgi:GAF domain-containing protein